MALALFAGFRVSDLEAAIEWYGRILGGEPSFLPNDTEAVWELAENRFVYIELDADRAGNSRHVAFVDDLDATVESIAARGIEPDDRLTYANGVRKAIYRDSDGNALEFGGEPA